MQVPPDLAMRLSSAAQSTGRSPEWLLREAICRLIESTAHTLPAVNDTDTETRFIPQAPRFSVYE